MVDFRLCRLLTLTSLFITIDASFKRVCYFSNWSQYRQPPAKFTPSDIDPNLCTHIVYAFASMEGNKLKTLEQNDVQLYRGVNALKKKNANLKTLLGVGGWNFGTQKMTAMLATDHSRREFAKTTANFLRKYDFDGIDLDFEYPGSRGSPAEDKQRYARLVQEMRQAFEEDAYLTGKPRLLLTAAVAAGKGNIDRGYDAKALARNLDFINVMTYDLHGPWDKKVGHNSPMYAPKGASESESQLTVEWAANYWVSLGVPRHMLVIGLPTYGRCFTLQNPSLHDMGDPITGPGKQGKFTQESGFLAYYEICDMKKQGASVVDLWDKEQQVPYLYQGDQWVGYDNVRSVSQKVRWIKQKGFGGWMVWNLDLDDFRGSYCGEGKYPLISAMVRAAQGSASGYQTQQSYNNAVQVREFESRNSYAQSKTELYQPSQQSSFVPLTKEPYKQPQPKPQPSYVAPNTIQYRQQQTYNPPQQIYKSHQVQPYQTQQQQIYIPPKVQPFQPPQQQTYIPPKVQQYRPRKQQYYSTPEVQQYLLRLTTIAPKVQKYHPTKQTNTVQQYQSPKRTFRVDKIQPYKPPQHSIKSAKVQPIREAPTYTTPKVQRYKPSRQSFNAQKLTPKPYQSSYTAESVKPYDPQLQLSFSSPTIDSYSTKPTERPIYKTQTKIQAVKQNTYNGGNPSRSPSTYSRQNSNRNNNNNNIDKNTGYSMLPNVFDLMGNQHKRSFNVPRADPGYKWVILPVYAIHPNAAPNVQSMQDIETMSLSDLTTDLSYSQRNPPRLTDTSTRSGLIAVCTRLGPGIHAHPNEHCFRYLMCDHRNGHQMKCEHGTVFDPNSKVCQWPTLVPSRSYCFN